MKNGRAIIWDWNGTLLDDVHICINGINGLLKDRQLPLLDETIYKEIFTFPVRDYYERAGFDFDNEPFDIPALQFIDYYRHHIGEAELFPEVIGLLEYFMERGFKQSILSAMENDFLHQSLRDKKIHEYFDYIRGIDDHFAVSKTQEARKLISSMQTDPRHTTIIGDTIHDYEVAKEIGCEVLLVSQGHQSANRLTKLDCHIINSLGDLKAIFEDTPS